MSYDYDNIAHQWFEVKMYYFDKFSMSEIAETMNYGTDLAEIKEAQKTQIEKLTSTAKEISQNAESLNNKLLSKLDSISSLIGSKTDGIEKKIDALETAVKSNQSNHKYLQDHKTEVKDIYELNVDSLLNSLGIKRGELDLLAGGPPCQGFSIQRGGEDTDVRNNLVGRYIEVVKAIRPKFFLMENVPGIVGKRGAAILEENLKAIEKEGYHIHQQMLDAQHFDVPQRRQETGDKIPESWKPGVVDRRH